MLILWALMGAAIFLANVAKPRYVGMFYDSLGYASNRELLRPANETLVIFGLVTGASLIFSSSGNAGWEARILAGASGCVICYVGIIYKSFR